MRVLVDPSTNWAWYEGVRRGDDLADPGYRVIGEHLQGGFAELVVVPAANLVQLPDDVTYETAAAAAMIFATAWGGLVGRAAVRPGERVLVTGASGGVATAAIQVARRAGASVIAVTSGPENALRVRELGADLVIDRLAGPFGTLLKEATRVQGVDVVFDSVGQPLWGSLIRCLRPGGRLVCYGSTAGPEAVTDLRHVFWKRLSILGTTMASPAEFVAVMELVFDGRLTPVIDRTLPLEQVAEGHRALEAGEIFGKVVIRI
jgi:NADPH:quinone reductase-like Zn-dependent oxidoreductase